MTIKKLSKKNQSVEQKEDHELINQFIGGGGKTTEESKNNNESADDVSRFTIRIPNDLVKMIDKNRGSKVGNVSRNTWILEAIAIRLNQEKPH